MTFAGLFYALAAISALLFGVAVFNRNTLGVTWMGCLCLTFAFWGWAL